MKLTAALLASAGLAGLAGTALGHSELEKPLYVAEYGVDQGRCHDPAKPCRTISYALQRVGKGGQVRVATGSYEIDDVRDLFHMVSAVVNVRGGYDARNGFQQPTARASTLVGVPREYRAMLASRGFHVIADRKTIDRDVIVETERLLALQSKLQSNTLSAAPCVGGTSGGLACENAELLAHVSLNEVSAQPAGAMDIWGFVDLNTGREYAIVGYQTGTGVFDITDAENPLEVGFIDGAAAGWRDIKVHQFFNAAQGRWNAYAYVTTDLSSDGLFIIDLSGLPHSVSRQSYASDFSQAHNVFISNVDFSTGLSLTGASPSLIVAGSNNGSGRFRLYSLANPAAPAFVAIPGSATYMHDAASMIIRDSRKDTQCVLAVDYCEVLFDFSEDAVE
ncbi:MAG: choice-of-anchor B family protein, partial [Woeseiaceae bacterium]|nr:choice-of-anchor B family protein [Woeseiaceae bacterium]